MLAQLPHSPKFWSKERPAALNLNTDQGSKDQSSHQSLWSRLLPGSTRALISPSSPRFRLKKKPDFGVTPYVLGSAAASSTSHIDLLQPPPTPRMRSIKSFPNLFGSHTQDGAAIRTVEESIPLDSPNSPMKSGFYPSQDDHLKPLETLRNAGGRILSVSKSMHFNLHKDPDSSIPKSPLSSRPISPAAFLPETGTSHEPISPGGRSATPESRPPLSPRPSIAALADRLEEDLNAWVAQDAQAGQATKAAWRTPAHGLAVPTSSPQPTASVTSSPSPNLSAGPVVEDWSHPPAPPPTPSVKDVIAAQREAAHQTLERHLVSKWSSSEGSETSEATDSESASECASRRSTGEEEGDSTWHVEPKLDETAKSSGPMEAAWRSSVTLPLEDDQPASQGPVEEIRGASDAPAHPARTGTLGQVLGLAISASPRSSKSVSASQAPSVPGKHGKDISASSLLSRSSARAGCIGDEEADGLLLVLDRCPTLDQRGVIKFEQPEASYDGSIRGSARESAGSIYSTAGTTQDLNPQPRESVTVQMSSEPPMASPRSPVINLPINDINLRGLSSIGLARGLANKASLRDLRQQSLNSPVHANYLPCGCQHSPTIRPTQPGILPLVLVGSPANSVVPRKGLSGESSPTLRKANSMAHLTAGETKEPSSPLFRCASHRLTPASPTTTVYSLL